MDGLDLRPPLHLAVLAEDRQDMLLIVGREKAARRPDLLDLRLRERGKKRKCNRYQQRSDHESILLRHDLLDRLGSLNPHEPLVQSAVQAKQVQLSELYRDPATDRILMAVTVPVGEKGALILDIEASRFLYPYLESWPTARGLEFRQALLRALSISRHDRAIESLKQLATDGRPQDAADARAALELFPEKHAP